MKPSKTFVDFCFSLDKAYKDNFEKLVEKFIMFGRSQKKTHIRPYFK